MTSPNEPGRLIVFEGTDGTGKSTQLKLLANALQEKGLAVVSTREPTDGKYGQQIRELYTGRGNVSLEEELNLFLADRQEHVESFLRPALHDGKIILCDRYYLSTIAYQGAAGLEPSMILNRNSFAPVPDLAILFHAPIAIGVKRITQNRGDTQNDFEKEGYLKKVAQQFELLNLPYIRRIDASGTIETVHREVLKLVLQLLEA